MPIPTVSSLSAVLGQHLAPVGGAPLPDTPIAAVHLSELLDPSPYLAGGVLLLTVGVSLPTNRIGCKRYVAALKKSDVSAVAFGLGPKFDVPAGGLGGTYAGNPVACAAALGALETIEREALVQRARDIEAKVKPRLAALTGEASVVGEVRGRGAMLAIEFVRPGTTAPAPELARAVSAACHAQGVLVLVCGTFGNVIRLLPPLVICDDLLDDALDVICGAIDEVQP
ncbi:aminotransferase class III-fold pyridoxal phosphate-dependent enzyme [Streptomyces malaysiensis]|uniref:aminotransferase class III-fold pyridoxal phosphate-dependent enzyme n=1 Tax=Streptomyces malaysiensis TaxID=92644 RepID=UPI003718916A